MQAFCQLIKQCFAAVLLLASHSLFAAVLQVDAESIDFDNTYLTLGGHVKLTHPNIQIHSAQAKLKKDPNNVDFLFSNAIVSGDVSIATENGLLKCENAAIDFNTLKGKITSDKYVSFTSKIVNQKTIPIWMSSKGMEFRILRKYSDQFEVDYIKALNDVRCKIGDEFALKSDTLSFEKSSLSVKAKEEIPAGIITFTSGKNPCVFSHTFGEITTSKVVFDTSTLKASLYKAKGHFDQGPSLTFNAEEITYAFEDKLLHLIGQCLVKTPEYGTLASEGSITLKQDPFNKHPTIDYIESHSFTQYTYLQHQMTCHGTTILNRLAGQLSLIAPTLSKGNEFDLSRQCHYRNDDLSLYASRIHTQFDEKAKTLQSIQCHGDVLIQLDNREMPLEMAFATDVTYNLQNHSLTLSSDEHTKVILWKKNEGVSLVTDELVVNIDPTTKKKMVECKGDARCFMTQKEQEKFVRLLKK